MKRGRLREKRRRQRRREGRSKWTPQEMRRFEAELDRIEARTKIIIASRIWFKDRDMIDAIEYALLHRSRPHDHRDHRRT